MGSEWLRTLPDGNNVYGVVTAPQGLEPVLRAIAQVFTEGRAYIYRSQSNGAETLKLRSELVEFASDRLDDGIQHLFNGAVGGTLEDVIRFVQAMSDAFSRAGIEHAFEVYDGDQIAVRIPDCD